MNARTLLLLLAATSIMSVQATNWFKTKEEKVVETQAAQAKKEIQAIEDKAEEQIKAVVNEVKETAKEQKAAVK
ncbi:hypothetical protein H0X48_02890 [Candidatus Dependentiae bacterium]|nr:hypothetical protein [Candidatus Dependentiae bacterium]